MHHPSWNQTRDSGYESDLSGMQRTSLASWSSRVQPPASPIFQMSFSPMSPSPYDLRDSDTLKLS